MITAIMICVGLFLILGISMFLVDVRHRENLRQRPLMFPSIERICPSCGDQNRSVMETCVVGYPDHHVAGTRRYHCFHCDGPAESTLEVPSKKPLVLIHTATSPWNKN